jgi:peptidoglycan-associated lipoprotein
MNRLMPLLPLSAVLACAHAPKAAEAAPPPAPAPAVAMAPAPPPPAPAPAVAARSCSADTECSASQLCVRSSCVAITPALEECGVTRVHFDFDQAELHQAELPKLERMARCLGADRAVHVVIEGNADERGTVEYNLHLGDRRASAVERYLEGMGVPGPQLATVSYGKEIPLCTRHDEECWSRNRRASVVPNGRAKVISRLEKLDERAEGRAARRKTAAVAPASQRRVATSQGATAPAPSPGR